MKQVWTIIDSDGGPGLELNTRRDVERKLKNAPAGFKAFAEKQVGVKDEYGCRSNLNVTAMHPAGFVFGGEGDTGDGCGGGNVALWSNRSGEWKEVYATQDMWPCYVLAKARVPKKSGQECYTGDNESRKW